MNERESFAKRLHSEIPAFLRVIRAMPADRLDYRPHPKSTAAGDLAWMLAQEAGQAGTLIDAGRVEYVEEPAPKSVETIASAFERGAVEIEKRLPGLDEARWQRKAQFLYGGKVAWEETLGEMLWGFLFDMVHHRGQLSTYLRPMGGKVPSIYGPSGDDPGA
ncbi:MAG TPA: DinB family protein [Thermoanaerobaculia bacterium]|jgi:uncharacterized damage-inducible protein DinB